MGRGLANWTLMTGIAITACSSEEESMTAYKELPFCQPVDAQLAAYSSVTSLLTRITDPKTRDVACSELDALIRSENHYEGFTKFKPDNCEWSYEQTTSPYQIAKAFLEPGDSLSVLCNWERKDAERRLHDEGRAILNSLPREEREQIEQEWNAYAPHP